MLNLFLAVAMLFGSCAASRLSNAVVEGTADNFIRTSPEVESIRQRLEGLESSMLQNQESDKVRMNSINLLAKMLDIRLERIERMLQGRKPKFKGLKEPKSLFDL